MAAAPDEIPLLFDEHNNFVVVIDELLSSRQYYVSNTNVLVTEMHGRTGVVEVTDAFTLRSAADLTDDVPALRGELLRYVRVLEGSATLHVRIQPGGDPRAERHGGGIRWRFSGARDDLRLITDRPLASQHTTTTVYAGDDLWFLLRWNDTAHRAHHTYPRRLLDGTTTAWRQWSDTITYRGPHQRMVNRSALALKLLCRSGAVNPARTASTIRDIGLDSDADHILGSVMDALEERPPGDEHGHVLDCAYQWSRHGGPIDNELWKRLAALADAATRLEQPPTTYSAAMRQLTLDRAARLSDHLGITGSQDWQTTAAALRSRILRDTWAESRQGLTTLAGSGECDPRLLSLPAYGVVPTDHPRIVATANIIAEQLSRSTGTRIHPAGEGPGTALTNGFLLAENLCRQNRFDEANTLYEKLSAKANALGLFSERIDLANGHFVDYFPSATAHTEAIACACALARAAN
nr:Glucoamylase [Kibdelosporangium sp. MJ126-NF4]CTQ91217.1 Glucoamylase (EC 3.2.1.3) [Kibdelosporangium sp. MJ126-NF4]